MKNQELLDTLSVTIMGLAGLAAGIYLFTQAGSAGHGIGGALIGAVSSAFFLHQSTSKVNRALTTTVTNTLDTLLGKPHSSDAKGVSN